MAWRGVPQVQAFISPPLPKMAETVGGEPFSPGAPASPSLSPQNLSNLDFKAEVEFLTHLA